MRMCTRCGGWMCKRCGGYGCVRGVVGMDV